MGAAYIVVHWLEDLHGCWTHLAKQVPIRKDKTTIRDQYLSISKITINLAYL